MTVTNRWQFWIDRGGTFTDVVVTDGSGGFTVGKALTDRERAYESIRAGLSGVAEDLGTDVDSLLRETSLLIYGTTRATNAIVESKVARTAFLTTEGFPDVLVLKEGGKFEPHRLDMEYPEPYVPRSLTFELPERIDAEGERLGAADEVDGRRSSPAPASPRRVMFGGWGGCVHCGCHRER